uniref:Fido domain-containing protein n=1 Tax=Globodera pallida TaxID=36090 RepID=A0A183BZQ5_GLOPA
MTKRRQRMVSLPVKSEGEWRDVNATRQCCAPTVASHRLPEIATTILSLHKSILGRHVGAGVLRTHDVSVGDDFDPMDWDEVPAEMDKYVQWLDAEMKAGVMSAAEFAAHASHRFLFIHPFIL